MKHPIDEVLSKYGTNRNQISMMANIPPSTLKTIVQRKTPIEHIKLGTLLSIANALKIPLAQLIKELMKEQERNHD